MVISGRDSGQESADKGLSVHHRGLQNWLCRLKMGQSNERQAVQARTKVTIVMNTSFEALGPHPDRYAYCGFKFGLRLAFPCNTFL